MELGVDKERDGAEDNVVGCIVAANGEGKEKGVVVAKVDVLCCCCVGCVVMVNGVGEEKGKGVAVVVADDENVVFAFSSSSIGG